MTNAKHPSCKYPKSAIMRIIINADDLGVCPRVSNSIFGLIDDRRISSATLIANSPYIEDAVKKTCGYNYVSFGIHLNLSSFHPLSKHKGLSPIIDEKGNFNTMIRSVKIDRRLQQGIFDEWSCQIKLLRKIKLEISHIDSHHHVHTIPQLFPVLKQIQKKFKIRKVRTTMNTYKPDALPSNMLFLQKRIYHLFLKHFYLTKTTDAFTDLFSFYEVGKHCKLKHKVTEIMTHPGANDPDEETKLLYSNWQGDLKFKTKLINYNDL